MLLSQGCCFINSLLFSYVLQEDSVKFSRKFISVPCQSSGRHGNTVQTLISQQHPSGQCGISSRRSSVKASSVRRTRTFRPDAHQCLEASNSSRLHQTGRNGKSSGRSSESEKNLALKYIRPDDMAIPSRRHSVFNKH
jgi:hypothetical protein